MALSVNAAVSCYVTTVNAKQTHVTADEVYNHAMQAYRDGVISSIHQSAIIANRDTVANNHNALVDAFAAGNAAPILRNLGINHSQDDISEPWDGDEWEDERMQMGYM